MGLPLVGLPACLGSGRPTSAVIVRLRAASFDYFAGSLLSGISTGGPSIARVPLTPLRNASELSGITPALRFR
jgi:hypothetical protein